MKFYYNTLYHSMFFFHRHIIVCPPTTDTLVCPSDSMVCLLKTDLKHLGKVQGQNFGGQLEVTVVVVRRGA